MMNRLYKFPVAMTALGLAAASSFAEIKVGDNLALSGFLDMSINGAADDDDETLNASFDQFEVDFMLKYDKISARADINALPSGSTALTDDTIPNVAVTLEQGFVSWTPGAVSLSTGRFLSSSGFEAAEPTGLYQFSTSKNLFYGGYQNGVNVAFATPMFGLYGAVVSDLWNANEFDILNSPGFEGQLSVNPIPGLTAKATYLYQMYDEDLTGGDDQQGLANIWASFTTGPFLVAAEYNFLQSWVVGLDDDETGHGWLVMGNMKFGNVYAATLRYSGNVLGDLDPDTEVTFSPSAALSPQWLAVAEIRYDIDIEVTRYAVESLFSF